MIQLGRLQHSSSLFVCLLILALMGCSPSDSDSIYRGLEAEEDGVLAVEIEGDEEGGEGSVVEPAFVDTLSGREKALVDELHGGEEEKISFLLVNAKTKEVMKSYRSLQSRKLASVSKIATSLAALENLRRVNMTSMTRMLKKSHNGEASRYARLAAKAIDGTTIRGPGYTEAHSCPSAVYQESPLGKSILKWVQQEIPTADWESSSLWDGAGCMHANQMSSEQTIHLLNYALNKGPAYKGKTFVDLLAIAGKDGTLRSRNRDHKGMIFAKTGTLTPAANLAGYIFLDRDGETHKYYFAIFVEKKGSGSYTSRARKMIESFVRLWINELLVEEGDPLYQIDLPSANPLP